MANKQLISTELTLSTVNREGEQPSGGSIELFVYQHDISSVTIGQIGEHTNTLIATPPGSRAYYLPEYQDFEISEEVSWSGTSADLKNSPLTILSITIIAMEDPVTGESISVGSSVGGTGEGMGIRYDSTLEKLVSDRAFTGDVDVRYIARRRLIRYHPMSANVQGGTGGRDATLATFGRLYARRSKKVISDDNNLSCGGNGKKFVWWKGKIDIPAADPNNGEWFEIAKVTSEYVAGTNSDGIRGAYELPPGYPDNLQHSGANYKIPDPADEEDMKQQRKHMRWKVNTVTGHIDFDSYVIAMEEPFLSNGVAFIPKTKFTRQAPSDEKAKKAYGSVNWENIRKQIIKEFPECEDLP